MDSHLVSALEAQGKYDEAIETYRGMIRQDPRDLPTYLNLGRLLTRLGRVDEAEELYRREIRRFRHDHSGHYCLGMLYQQQGRPDEALTEMGVRPARPKAGVECTGCTLCYQVPGRGDRDLRDRRNGRREHRLGLRAVPGDRRGGKQNLKPLYLVAELVRVPTEDVLKSAFFPKSDDFGYTIHLDIV